MNRILLSCFLNVLICLSLYHKPQYYGSNQIKHLELQKAEIIRDHNLERYSQLKELYKDHPNNKDLKQAELNYHLSEIEVEIKNLLVID